MERAKDREREGEKTGERRRDGVGVVCWLGEEELQEKWIKDKERGPQGKAPAGVLSKQGCVSRERPSSNI